MLQSMRFPTPPTLRNISRIIPDHIHMKLPGRLRAPYGKTPRTRG